MKERGKVLPELPLHLYHFLFHFHVQRSHRPLVTHAPHVLSVSEHYNRCILHSAVVTNPRSYTLEQPLLAWPVCLTMFMYLSQFGRVLLPQGLTWHSSTMCMALVQL